MSNLQANNKLSNASPEKQALPELQQPFTLLSPALVTPDFTSARRYGAFLDRLRASMFSDRQQLIFTDDPQAAAKVISNFFLHVDSLNEGKLSALDKMMIGLSLSPEEVANSDSLYVNRDSGESAAEAMPLHENDAVNQKRLDPRVFDNVGIIDFSHPAFTAFIKDIWARSVARSVPYDVMEPGLRDVNPFCDHTISVALLKHFEADPSRIAFINLVQTQEDAAERKQTLLGVHHGLYREKRASFDLREYPNSVPHVVWILPWKDYGEYDYMMRRSGNMTYEYPDRSVLLFKPFDRWTENLSTQFATSDAEWKKAGYVGKNDKPHSERFFRHDLEDILEGFGRRIEAKAEQKGVTAENLCTWFGISETERAFLQGFRAADI